MRGWHLFCAGAAFAASAVAQGNSSFTLNVTYDRPGLPVPHWELQILPDGRATYTARHTEGGVSSVQSFIFSNAGLAKVRTSLDGSHGMQPCETKTKGIARMGQKTLVYTVAGGAPQQCSYNYTDNKGLAAATDYLLAATTTLDEGAELEHLHRFDRLGLDPVMERLGSMANEGKAVELGSIRAELQSLAADPQVLERVRTKAAQLLEAAQREDAGLRVR